MMNDFELDIKHKIASMNLDELSELNHNLSVLKDLVSIAYIVKCDMPEDQKILKLNEKYNEFTGDDLDMKKFRMYLDNVTNDILVKEIMEIQDETLPLQAT